MSGTTGTRLASPAAGSAVTAGEIDQQPDVWREAAQTIRARRDELDLFLEPLLARDDLRIVLTGAGTSAFVGDVCAPTLSRLLGRRVESVPTTSAVSNPQEVFAEDVPTLLVSFARSGNSPESTAATRLADQCLGDVHHLVLTCDGAGALALAHRDSARSLVLLMPERANDQGFAMTSSFTSMLLSCLLVFVPGRIERVGALSAAAEALIGERLPDIESLAGMNFARVVYLGSGSLAGLARESALKLLELTAGAVVTYFDSALGFRHGPKSVLDDDTLALVYVSSDPYTCLYDLDIVRELRRTLPADRVTVVSASAVPHEVGPAWVLDGLDGLEDAFLACVFVIVAQLVGLTFAVARGITADNPFPGNEVNRVVQGVTVHELQDRPSPGESS